VGFPVHESKQAFDSNIGGMEAVFPLSLPLFDVACFVAPIQH